MKNLIHVLLLILITTIGVGAQDLANASFVQNFKVNTQEGIPEGLAFNNTGTKCYIVGKNGFVVSYQLTRAYDISTAVFHQDFSVLSQELTPTGLTFNMDGSKMYIIGNRGDDINEYALGTSFDISTASYVQKFSVKAQETGPHDLVFAPTGTKLFVIGKTGDDVNEYTLSSSFDVSTAVFVQSIGVEAEETEATGLTFNSTGTKMFIIGTKTDNIHQYDLEEAYDIGSATYVQSLDIKPQEGNPTSIVLTNNDTQLFILGKSGDEINQYAIPPDNTDPDEDGDEIPASLDCNDNDANLTTTGASCDDGNVDTENDLVTENCTCEGTLIDPDNDEDGVLASLDCDDNNANLTTIGASCDDGNAATENDVVTADCTCEGTLIDPDNDGDEVPASLDCNDNNANVSTIGAACNDNDSTTSNDVVTSNCLCEGTTIEGGPGLSVWTDNTSYLSYDKKVLIGATTNLPDGFGLYVEQGVLTEKVKVALIDSDDWADYVFQEDYVLKPIQEVAAFVKIHKHLPNVPSAAELHKKGIDLGKMDATLLQQIEELWLHVIDLKEENESLKKKVAALEGDEK